MSTVPVPPGGPLQVAFSFDTTGSMSSALGEVRGRLSAMLQRLQADIPGVTTAVVAHGDYCDAGKPYLTKHMDFSDNLPDLVEFVNKVGELVQYVFLIEFLRGECLLFVQNINVNVTYFFFFAFVQRALGCFVGVYHLQWSTKHHAHSLCIDVCYARGFSCSVCTYVH